MSRIAVVTSSPPMVEGGHMVIARCLVEALREAGHSADIVVTPQNRFGRQGSAYIATWLTDVGSTDGQPIDQVISLRYPSYAVRHPNHVCWLNHTMREYYDMWPRFIEGLGSAGRAKALVRRALIHKADRYLLTRNVRKLFVQSRTIQQRLTMWPDLQSTVLYPPAPQRPYRFDGWGNYVFMLSRLTPLKRADLLLEALARPETAGIRAVLAGEGAERERLVALIARLGLADRVTLAGRLSDDQLLDHLARCRVVCFPPLEEDYGFVTVEAFRSHKGVVTCRDSGGPAELVENGVTGIICEPTPAALAGALADVMTRDGVAERMGTAAFAAGGRLNWADTVKALTT